MFKKTNERENAFFGRKIRGKKTFMLFFSINQNHLGQHGYPYLSEKIEINCHKSRIHSRKLIQNDPFSFGMFKTSGSFFKPIVYF